MSYLIIVFLLLYLFYILVIFSEYISIVGWNYYLREALYPSLSKTLNLSKELVVWAYGMYIPMGDLRKLRLE